MNQHNAYIKNIRKAVDEDRLAIFVGAGVSKSADTEYVSLPLWSDLITELKSDLNITEELDYLKLAQLYYLEFGEQLYIQTLKKYFPEGIAPSSLHSIILKLNPRVIITTNWDCIIENAIAQEGYLYETICTDKDLVNSTSQNKFIKIHGDFKNHNIVFKEDDYLNYSRNFPLIENYIKSIFSTFTVLFLGYSYNDVNLKHIMKWIQSHSTSAPPMYLVSFDINKPQESYLRNHGITTLVLNKENYSIEEFSHLSEMTALTQSFLTSIIRGQGAFDPNNEREVINFLYGRIKHLKHQNSVSHKQILRTITNCGLRYDIDGLSILELFEPNGVLTTDYCTNTRLIYEIFLKILSSLDSMSVDEKEAFYWKHPRFTDILFILALASIKGIVISRDSDTGRRWYFANEKTPNLQSMEDQDREHLSLSSCKSKSRDPIKSLSSESFDAYKSGDYELAFTKNSELILACRRHRIYSILLIALFNKKLILRKLQFSYPVRPENEFENEIEIVLQDEFFKFPRPEIKKNQALYEFLSLQSVYQQANECTKKILNLTRSVKNIKAGGFSFDNFANEPSSTHVNLLMFALKNHIMIEQYEPYISAMRDFVKISILRQSTQKKVILNQYELYSAIQFFKVDELRSELSVFFKNQESNQLMLCVSETCTEWITSTILPNLVTQVIQEKGKTQVYETRFENCVQLLALNNLDNEAITKVMHEFSRLVSSSSTTIGIYQAINQFLGHQNNLFSQANGNEVLLDILNSLIDKIISNKAHGWDRHAILYGLIDNLYDSIYMAVGKYSDTGRVERLLSVFRDQTINTENKRKYARSLLYSIYQISNEEIQNSIKAFIQDLISQANGGNIDDLIFQLWVVAVEFKVCDSEIVEKLSNYIQQVFDGGIISLKLNQLENLIQYLVVEKKVEVLAQLNRDLGKFAERKCATQSNPS